MKGKFTILFVFTSMSLWGQTILNPSFENWAGPGCQSNTTPDNWVNFSLTGNAADEKDKTNCPKTIPSTVKDGLIYARMIGNFANGGEGFSQNIPGFTINNDYRVNFFYCGSNWFGSSSDVQFHMFLDGVDVIQSPIFSPLMDTWTPLFFDFTATATNHTIAIRLYANPGGSSEASADDFSITNITGINELEKELIRIAPNPVVDWFSINGSGLSGQSILIFDTLGHIVYSSVADSNFQNIDFQNQPGGIYFVKIGRTFNRIVKL
jgi:hypothetical protein